jgi:DNA repair photolyase
MKKQNACVEETETSEFKNFIRVPIIGEKTLHCYYPMRLDTCGNGCVHNCSYCYAGSLLKSLKSWHPESPSVADPVKVEKFIRSAMAGNNKWSETFMQRVPVRMGGMTDCFGETEIKSGVALKTLKVLNEYRYPYVIMTKGLALARPEYLKAIDPDLCAVQISISCKDSAAKIVEPGAPATSKRFKLAKTLVDAGILTSVRLAPITNLFTYDLAEKSCKAGVDTVISEFLRFPMNRRPSLAQYFDVSAYVRDGPKYHLPVAMKVPVLEKIKGICDRYGVDSTICDDHDVDALMRFRANKDDCCNIIGKRPAFDKNFSAVREKYTPKITKLAFSFAPSNARKKAALAAA